MSPVHGYSKEQRVRTPDEFKSVFAQARKKRGLGFSVHIWRNDKQTVPRLGISVSKKQVKTAVERNRLKRIIRENFRQHAANLKVCDMVFVVYRELAAMDNKTITMQLAPIWDGLKRS